MNMPFKRDQINVSDELLDSLKRSEALYRKGFDEGRKAGKREGYQLGYLEGERDILNEVQAALDALEAKRPAKQAG